MLDFIILIRDFWVDLIDILNSIEIQLGNHKYELTAFIYQSRKYIYPRYFDTKAKLHRAIQKLLQEEL